MTKNFFFVGIILAASGLLSPPLALAVGLAYGMLLKHPYHVDSKRLAKFLLQASVVCLGFGMNLGQVLKAGRSGFVYTAIGITLALALGILLGGIFRVGRTQSFLISAGTAVCGGSAIAALGPVANANDEEIAVSLGTVYVLNSIALFVFPALGTALHMSQTQFGLWSALAIHDTSSVVGAAAKYGITALAIGTTIKLARALWIVPLAFGTAAVKKNGARVHLPWFILYFCIASVMVSFLPQLRAVYASAYQLGKLGLAVTLFLIGTGISRQTLKQTGIRPLLQGLLLWIVVAGLSLAAILHGTIHL
jgi:uncharacterized integral membrane protein (TIGR00698 family)